MRDIPPLKNNALWSIVTSSISDISSRNPVGCGF